MAEKSQKTQVSDHTKALMDISKKLQIVDKKRLIFLCKDHIAHQDLDNIKTGLDLFKALERGRHVKKDCDVSLLLEILYAVGRIDLCDGLAEKMKVPKFTNKTKKHISKYRYLLLEITMTLADQEVDDMKYMVSELLGCDEDNIEDIFNLLTQLEKNGCISKANVRCLYEDLISHQRLKTKLKEYEEAIQVELEQVGQEDNSTVDGELEGRDEITLNQRHTEEEFKETVLMKETTNAQGRTSTIEAAGLSQPSTNSDREPFVLQYSLLTSLSKLLNSNHPLGNDWRGLAGQYLDLTADDVYDMERKENPTRYVLDLWRERGKTLADLKTALEQMGRTDCSDKIQEHIEKGDTGEARYRFSSLSAIAQPTDNPMPSGLSSETDGSPLRPTPGNRARTLSDNESYDIFLLFSEHDVDTDIYKDVTGLFTKMKLSTISMHELVLGKDKFSNFYIMLERCSYTMCLLTPRFLKDVWCKKYVIQACEKAVREEETTVLYVKDKGFSDADIPSGLKGITGTEHGSWAFEKVLKNTFKALS
ncbi:uncharacterized protein [Amphiura filiformis]|uniref:uncharacterized protein n=1 Tax=Amphiura filiformis TaxID=82378 RepID=UPI003B21728D